MKLIVDRFEEKYAICEDENKKYITIEKENLPLNVKIGDIIILNEDEVYVEKKESKKRREYIEEITKNIWE